MLFIGIPYSAMPPALREREVRAGAEVTCVAWTKMETDSKRSLTRINMRFARYRLGPKQRYISITPVWSLWVKRYSRGGSGCAWWCSRLPPLAGRSPRCSRHPPARRACTSSSAKKQRQQRHQHPLSRNRLVSVRPDQERSYGVRCLK